MIKTIKAKKQYKDEIGDILYGKEYISGKIKEIPEEYNVLPFFFSNPFKSLKIFGVDIEIFEKKFQYECPFSDNKYYWFVPSFLLVRDSNVYRKNKDIDRNFDYLFDSDFQKMYNEHRLEDGPDKVVNAFLGHGYTTFTLPSDGHGNVDLVSINLDNDDKIVGHCHIWYNK